MTEISGHAGFFACRLLPVAIAVAFAAGCSTTNLEDVAPVASMQAPQTLPQTMTPPPAAQAPAAEQTVVAAPEPSVASERTAEVAPARDAINTGTFPNLNVAPGAAAPQITTSERTAKLAVLGAKRSSAQSAPGTNAGAEAAKVKRLRKLAQSHAVEALKEIEGN